VPVSYELPLLVVNMHIQNQLSTAKERRAMPMSEYDVKIGEICILFCPSCRFSVFNHCRVITNWESWMCKSVVLGSGPGVNRPMVYIMCKPTQGHLVEGEDSDTFFSLLSSEIYN
jgi:hypothetical protein